MNETTLDVPETEKSANSFDVIAALNAVRGPFVEVGGPTHDQWPHEYQYRLVDISKLSKEIISTNIVPGVNVWEPSEEDGEYTLTDYLPADMQADGTKLPFKAASLGAVFASAVPTEIRPQVLQEAYRVLEPGGLLVWQHGVPEDGALCKKLGFSVLKHDVSPSSAHDYIFRK